MDGYRVQWDAPRHLPQLLLVLCTVLGVAALHTIGHATAEGTGGGTPRSVTAVAPVIAAVVPGVLTGGDTTDDGCGGDGCTHQVAQPDRDRHGAGWWEVCLAVLSVLATASLAAGVFLRTVRAGAVVTTSRRRRPTPDVRGLPPAGLTIASTSVLRT